MLFFTDGFLQVLELNGFQLELLLVLFDVGLLFLDNRVALHDLLLAVLELFFHLLNLAFVDSGCISQLGGLLLKGRDQTLRLLNESLFVFDFALQGLDQHHLLRNGLFLSELGLV